MPLRPTVLISHFVEIGDAVTPDKSTFPAMKQLSA